ncbi:MAG: DegQ family serine endoprotease [Deltaproteobacteria bacterium]|nr:DegQ family serine endoprotease [Deltaproteobacteria bacterium]
MKHRRVATIVALLLVAMSTVVCVADEKTLTNEPDKPDVDQQAADSATPVPSTDDLNAASRSFVELAKKATPAVAYLEVEKRVRAGGMTNMPFRQGDPFFEFFKQWGVPERDFVQRGQGSGFIISEDGYIITNNHVVRDAEKVKVKLVDERVFTAKIIGADPKTDLAVIKIEDPKALPVVPLGDSDKVEVGEWVVAIGNPFGLSHTVTAGIVSAKGRVIGAGPYDDFIQTDASINPGNSGGPLLNTRGEVIGINAMINASGQGIGFAIPVNLAKKIVAQLQASGTVTRGWLGVMIQPLSPEIAKAVGLDDPKGALVGDVFDDSPAAKAGIERGDVIRKFNGKSVDDSHDLPLLVAETEVDASVPVEIWRDGKSKNVDVTVAQMPDENTPAKTQDEQEQLGLTVTGVTPDVARALRLKPGEGAFVARVTSGSAAEDAGIRDGDVILQINRKPVSGPKDVIDALTGMGSGQTALLLIKREGETFFTTLAK